MFVLVIHRLVIPKPLEAKSILSLYPKNQNLILLRGKNFTRLTEFNDGGNAFPPIPLINRFLWFFMLYAVGKMLYPN